MFEFAADGVGMGIGVDGTDPERLATSMVISKFVFVPLTASK